MTTSRFLQGNFAPVQEELTATDLEVRGELPRELNGRLLRIGPNPVAPKEPYNWFTGNGMVHGIRLREGRALWYRNRYVRDAEVVEAKGWPEVPGPQHGMGANTANTNVIGHAGKTFAIVEAGALPVELTSELETVARSDFDGSLNGSFTAHPKRDPKTGELHAVTYYWEWDHLKYVIVGNDGRLRREVQIPVPGGPMVHDLAITDRFALLFDLPCTFDPSVLEAGSSFPYVWHPEHGSRMGLIPRDGEASDVRWFEVEPCYVFHPLNAYEVGDDQVVLDAVRHERVFDADRNGLTEGNPVLTRWTFDLAGGSVKEEQLDDRFIEFPRMDERRIGSANRYGYVARYAQDGEEADFPSLLKYDLETGASQEWDPGTGRSPLEPVFVPRSEDSGEDDGWILTCVYDANTNRSELVVLDAENLGDPIATVPLPARIPFGFHGNWVPDQA